jgi:hypothetical protein
MKRFFSIVLDSQTPGSLGILFLDGVVPMPLTLSLNTCSDVYSFICLPLHVPACRRYFRSFVALLILMLVSCCYKQLIK